MDRGVVGNTEVDFFLARIGNRDAGGASVSELARGDIIDDDGFLISMVFPIFLATRFMISISTPAMSGPS